MFQLKSRLALSAVPAGGFDAFPTDLPYRGLLVILQAIRVLGCIPAFLLTDAVDESQIPTCVVVKREAERGGVFTGGIRPCQAFSSESRP